MKIRFVPPHEILGKREWIIWGISVAAVSLCAWAFPLWFCFSSGI